MAGAHFVCRDKRGFPRPLKIETAMNMIKFCIASGTAVALLVGTLPAMAYTGEELANQAKVSIAEARAIALKAYRGKITDEELEKEKGGSGLRYSFDIKRGKVTQEVGVDAQTGKVLENAKEGPNPD
jgi:Peptidase propeptide and YPEB domain